MIAKSSFPAFLKFPLGGAQQELNRIKRSVGGVLGAARQINAVVGITPVASADENWWEAGGATGCVAAYQPKGAASYAASKINLSNPGTFNITDGVATGWNTTDGWVGNGTNQYLRTGVVIQGSWSVFVQFTSIPISNGAIFGCIVGLVVYNIRPRDSFPPGGNPAGWAVVSNTNGANVNVPVADPSPNANMGIAGAKVFTNGVEFGTNILPGTYTGAIEMYIFNRNNNGSPSAGRYQAGNIQALAIYNNTLTASQSLALATAMAAL